MSLIKSRHWTKQEDEDLLTVLRLMKEKNLQVTWNKIAELIKQRNPESRKNGKQCRQRWANQLDPNIKKNQNWSKEQNQTLFRLHFQLGNKWSQICSHIEGRTDNCVKNHFYSTMRKGLRKINSYIQNIKRKTILSKSIKNQILNKILTICQGKKDQKFQFNDQAKLLANEIKIKLAKLSLDMSDLDQQNTQFKQQIYCQILDFSRNCRRRKSKKSDQSNNDLYINHSSKRNNSQIQIKIQQKSLIVLRKTNKKDLTNSLHQQKVSTIQQKKKYSSAIEPSLLKKSDENIQKSNQFTSLPISKSKKINNFQFIEKKNEVRQQNLEKNNKNQIIQGNFTKLITSQVQDQYEVKQNFIFSFSFPTNHNIIPIQESNINFSFQSPFYSPFSFYRPSSWVFQQQIPKQTKQKIQKRKQNLILIKNQSINIIKPPPGDRNE